MKKLKEVLYVEPPEFSDADLETAVQDGEESDQGSVTLAMAHTADIIGMGDDIYNTLSQLNDVDQSIVDRIEKVVTELSGIFAEVDSKYTIDTADLGPSEAEFEESTGVSLNSLLQEEPASDDFNPGNGMEEAPIGAETFRAKGLVKLWGIPMRAGKWADTFVGQWEDGQYGIIDVTTGHTKYRNFADFKTGFAKLLKTGRYSSLSEKLGASASIADYIHDFVKSDAPQFKNRTKKEKIKMAIAAYYDAHPNEDLSKDEELAIFVYDFIAANSGAPLLTVIKTAVAKYFGSQK